MKACPVHPGIIIEHRPCYKCGPKVETQEDMPMQAVFTAESEAQVEVQSESGTVPLDAVEQAVERAAQSTWKQSRLERFKQEPLDGILWERYEPVKVKVMFAGSGYYLVGQLEEVGLSGFEPNDAVTLSIAGHIHAVYADADGVGHIAVKLGLLQACQVMRPDDE